MVEVKGLDHAVEVGGGGQDDEDVEDLVGAAPDVKGARPPAFGPSSLVCVSGLVAGITE